MTAPSESPDRIQDGAATGMDATKDRGLLARGIVALGLPFSLCFVASMVILLYEVVMRYVFNSPTLWAHEATIFLCGVGFIYGGLYCTACDRHIRIVLLYDAVSPRVRNLLDIAIYGICSVAAAAFSYAAWRMVERAIFTPAGDFRLETTGTAWNPPTPSLLKLFLLFTLVMISLQFLLLTIRALRRLGG